MHNTSVQNFWYKRNTGKGMVEREVNAVEDDNDDYSNKRRWISFC